MNGLDNHLISGMFKYFLIVQWLDDLKIVLWLNEKLDGCVDEWMDECLKRV